jgi:exodeoxyribonuclease V alpha subunit
MSRPPPQHPSQHLQVTVDSILYRSEDGRFGVARARKEPSGDEIVIVGELGHIAPGETLRLQGRWQDHATYGRRFRVERFAPVTPQTQEGIARYLGSGLVPGVGASLARRLVERFGERTLDVITTQSARLREVEGIGPQRARAATAIAHCRFCSRILTCSPKSYRG